MSRITQSAALIALTSSALQASAADAEAATGLTNTGTGLILIVIAVAVLGTLFFGAGISQLARLVVQRFGRRRIRRVLKRAVPDVIEDFILPGAYGGLTHIDFAVLTSGGILCIQTKYYNGIVFGEPNDPQWTNVEGLKRRKFLNPTIQNEGRARALQNVVPGVPVQSLVVFCGDSQFSAKQPGNVIHLSALAAHLEKLKAAACQIEDWDAVWLTVKSAALTDADSRKDFDAQLSFS